MLSALQDEEGYPYMGTKQDSWSRLASSVTQLDKLLQTATEVAGQMAIKMTYDHQFYLDYEQYNQELLNFIMKISPYKQEIKVSKVCFPPLTLNTEICQCLIPTW